MNVSHQGLPAAQLPWVEAALDNTSGRAWRPLYRTGGVAALITAAMTIVGIFTFILWPPPEGSVAVWFALCQRSWLIGMLGLDLPILISYVALIPVVIALYVALRRTGESLLALAAALGLVAIVTYLGSTRIFEMLALSQQYAVASTDAERAMLEAAGQSMLTTYLGAFAPPAPLQGWTYQGTAFNLGFALWCVAGVMFSAGMRRSRSFGAAAGWTGLAGNALALGLFVPGAGVWLSLAALPLLLVWYGLIGRGLLRLGHAPADIPGLE